MELELDIFQEEIYLYKFNFDTFKGCYSGSLNGAFFKALCQVLYTRYRAILVSLGTLKEVGSLF